MIILMNKLFCFADSLIYHVETEDFYQDMYDNHEWFDMSAYRADHPQFSKFRRMDNAKVLGKQKDEAANKVITSIVAPRPKMYCYEYLELPKDNDDQHEDDDNFDDGPGKYIYTPEEVKTGLYNFKLKSSKRAKGVSKVATKEQLSKADYVHVMEENVTKSVSMTNIRSTRHQIHTEEMTKTAVSALCTKRFNPDSVNSFAFGYKFNED
jgi:hypothetical protein